MTDCIFCKIIKGEIPCSKVYEDSKTIAFLDITPCNKGHTLVLPKKHYETMDDIPPEELQDLIVKIQKVAKAVVKAVNAEGYNVNQNNKKAAGQVIDHIHFHIIPRFSDDGHSFDWTHAKYEENEMDKVKEKISSFLK